ncbi:MAG: hypothetical protein EOP37_03200 [Rubrivivax sp.]|nr:MAG: hypothetical protein EOP37_03200 [Rubrivivax sp.]
MAAYPNYTLLADSASDVDAGITAGRATNGKVRARRMYAAAKRSFTLTHWLTGAEKDALMAHYAANRDDSFAFVWPQDGLSRTCIYINEPLPTQAQQPGRFVVVVKLMEA